jgi:hypothetical protein
MKNNSSTLNSRDLSINFVRVLAPAGCDIGSFLREAICLALAHGVKVQAVFNEKTYRIDPLEVVDSVIYANAVTPVG